MPSDLYLSTAQAAQALRVGVSTVKRWVDEGLLPAHRTAGGHRKLLRSEVLALAREGKLGSVDLAPLLLDAPPAQGLTAESLVEPLHAAIAEGDAARVRDLLRRAYRSGMLLETVADQIVTPVLRQIGHDWESNQIDVWQEHRGTQLCSAALHEIFAEVSPRAEKERPLALGAGPEGDPYHLALLLAQMALVDAGWQVVNLGPNTPFDTLANAVRELQPRLVYISASHLPDADRFLQQYKSFQRAVSQQGAAVAVGGTALIEAIRSRMVYTMFGDGLTQLLQFARTLHPRPRRPRRGRPAKT